MKLSGNTVLITGGGSGIGLALAEYFLKENNEVIISGRRKEILEVAKEKYPKLHIKVSDVSNETERTELLNWIRSEFSNINILINNAGIQQELNFKNGDEIIQKAVNEIRINFESPVTLSSMFIPLLSGKDNSAIINVSSGLAFVPIAVMPIYCSTKAALHSFSVSLRHQLKDSGIRVFELIPPTVDTDLDKGARRARGQTDFGIKPEAVAEETMKALSDDEYEIVVGAAKNIMNNSRTAFENAFNLMNSRR